MTHGTIAQEAVGTSSTVHLASNLYPARQETEAQAYQQGIYAAPTSDDVMAELQQLAEFYNRGLLADEEYAAAKQKLLPG